MKKIYLLLITISLASLLGCASGPKMQSAIELSPSHGYVYVNLPNTEGWSEVYIRSVETNKKHQMIKRSDTDVISFGLWVPPGTYHLDQFNGYKLKDYSEFKVELGRITDLGSLMSIPVGGYNIVALPLRHPETKDLVKLASKEYQNILSNHDPIRWTVETTPKPAEALSGPPAFSIEQLVTKLVLSFEKQANKPSINKILREESDPNAFFKLALEGRPPNYMEPTVGNNQQLFFGADLGQIRVRRPSGEWFAIDTEKLKTITAVAVHGNALIAGYKDGTIRSTTLDTNEWTTLFNLGTENAIKDIDFIDNKWFVVTSSIVPGPKNFSPMTGDITLYVSDDVDLKTLKMNRALNVENSNVLYSYTGKTDGKYYYLNSTPDLYRLELATMEWLTITPPHPQHRFHVANDGTVSAFANRGAFSKVYISTDQGDNWKLYNDPPHVLRDIKFYSADTGQAVRLNMGAFVSNLEVLDFDMENNKWNLSYEVPKGCEYILNNSDNRPQFCVTTAGSIISYTNNEWVMEFAAD